LVYYFFKFKLTNFCSTWYYHLPIPKDCSIRSINVRWQDISSRSRVFHNEESLASHLGQTLHDSISKFRTRATCLAYIPALRYITNDRSRVSCVVFHS